MERFSNWIKWCQYRLNVADELYLTLHGAWSWLECWSYSKNFQCQYESILKVGDKPNAKEDVEEEIHCWTE